MIDSTFFIIYKRSQDSIDLSTLAQLVMEVTDPISTILATKDNPQIWQITSDKSVLDAIKLMALKNIGALLVIDDGNLVGIVSERDYTRNVVLKDRSSKDTPVSDIMSKNLICVKPDVTIDIGLRLMTSKHVRHLPVVDSDEVIGVVSIGDLVKHVIAEQKALIQHLEHYIIGSYPG